MFISSSRSEHSHEATRRGGANHAMWKLSPNPVPAKQDALHWQRRLEDSPLPCNQPVHEAKFAGVTNGRDMRRLAWWLVVRGLVVRGQPRTTNHYAYRASCIWHTNRRGCRMDAVEVESIRPDERASHVSVITRWIYLA